jgi:hypothetical protein
LLSFALVRPEWSDIPIYERYSISLLSGQTPYTEFDFEYPPAAVIIFAIPGLAAKYLGHYDLMYRLFMMLFDLGIFCVLYGITGFLYKSDIKKILKVLAFYLLLTSLTFQIVLDRFDLAVAFMLLLSIYLIIARKQWIWGYFLLWLATLTKLFPIILIPLIFVYEYLNYKDRNRAVLDFGYGLASFLVLFASFFAWCGPWWNSVLAYHGERGLQIESLYSSVLLVGKLLGGAGELVRGHGAFELVSPGTSFLAKLSLPLTGALILGIYYIFWKVLSRRKRADHPDYLIKTIFGCLIAFVVFNKVFSPQYLLWLFPLVALAVSFSGFDNIQITCWVVTGAVTAVLFPYNYVSLLELQALGISLLILRNFSALVCAWSAFRHILK